MPPNSLAYYKQTSKKENTNMNKQQFALQALKNTMIALGTEEEVLEGMTTQHMAIWLLMMADGRPEVASEEMPEATNDEDAFQALMEVAEYVGLVAEGRENLSLRDTIGDIKRRFDERGDNLKLIAELERAYSNAFYEKSNTADSMIDWRGAAERTERLLRELGVSGERLRELEFDVTDDDSIQSDFWDAHGSLFNGDDE